jgi:hypothetical protein
MMYSVFKKTQVMSMVKIEFRPEAQRQGTTHTETTESTGRVHGRASASAILGFGSVTRSKPNTPQGAVKAEPTNQVDRLNALKPHALARALADMTDQEVTVLLPKLNPEKVQEGIQVLDKDERNRLMQIREEIALSQSRSRGTQAIAFADVEASRERLLDPEQARSRV